MERSSDMAYLYILYSIKRNRYYVGSTPDIEKRLKQHKQGKAISAKAGIPWRLVFVHVTESLLSARQLEYQLKTWKDRRHIERIVLEQQLLIKM